MTSGTSRFFGHLKSSLRRAKRTGPRTNTSPHLVDHTIGRLVGAGTDPVAPARPVQARPAWVPRDGVARRRRRRGRTDASQHRRTQSLCSPVLEARRSRPCVAAVGLSHVLARSGDVYRLPKRVVESRTAVRGRVPSGRALTRPTAFSYDRGRATASSTRTKSSIVVRPTPEANAALFRGLPSRVPRGSLWT